jgi:hypothetical protein
LISQAFNIYSDNINQIGTYTVTLVGFVTWYPDQNATTNFKLKITDPCTITKITGPNQIQNFMAFGGQKQTSLIAYTFNDTVS